MGIDLNEEQIFENKQIYKGTRLEFLHGEIMDWIQGQQESGIIFVTSGVLEYLTEKELQEFLTLVHENLSPAAFAISEPINICLKSQFRSTHRGGAAHSHNYPHLFNQCGYNIFRQQVQHIDPKVKNYDTVIMVAITDKDK